MINQSFFDNKEYLGKGMFSAAYRSDNEVFIATCDPFKEAISDIGFIPNLENDLVKLPECEYLDVLDGFIPTTNARKSFNRERDWHVYKMPFYHPAKLPAFNDQAIKLYRIIKDRHFNFNNSSVISIDSRMTSLKYDLVKHGFNDFYDELLNTVQDAFNYSNIIGLEFNRANLSADNYGNLILRDCLFCIELLRKERSVK